MRQSVTDGQRLDQSRLCDETFTKPLNDRIWGASDTSACWEGTTPCRGTGKLCPQPQPCLFHWLLIRVLYHKPVNGSEMLS